MLSPLNQISLATLCSCVLVRGDSPFFSACKTVHVHILLPLAIIKFSKGEARPTAGLLIYHKILFANACTRNKLRTGYRKSSQCSSVYSSHETLLWYVSPSDLLNCDLLGSMPCPLNEHVHWNTCWGLASTIWTNTNTEEFWLSHPPPEQIFHRNLGRGAKAHGITLNLTGFSSLPVGG